MTAPTRPLPASFSSRYRRRQAHAESGGCYKPIASEKPLWDFPDGCLAHREVATYLVSEVLGWNIVPDTGWKEVLQGQDKNGRVVPLIHGNNTPVLRRMAAFGVLGLTFHHEHKLRTVL